MLPCLQLLRCQFLPLFCANLKMQWSAVQLSASCVASGAILNFFWGGWIDMPFVIRILKIIWKILKIYFWPPYQGSKNLQKKKKKHYKQKIKIIMWGCLIAQMKRVDALITTGKPQLLGLGPSGYSWLTGQVVSGLPKGAQLHMG